MMAHCRVCSLLYSTIRLRDLTSLYSRVLSKTLNADNYEKELKDAYIVMKRVCDSRCVFGTDTSMEKLYNKYKEDSSILDDVSEVKVEKKEKPYTIHYFPPSFAIIC